MSLVAYDSSDEGSENENESAVVVIATDNHAIKTVIAQTVSSRLSLPPPKVSQSANEEEEEVEEKEEENSDTGDFKHFLDALPKPSGLYSADNIEEDDDIPLKKEMKRLAAKPIKRQTVKIAVPSLSEFKDLEEEMETEPIKVVQPSERGCGLFTVLTAPKVGAAKNKILIPHAVKNAAIKTNIQQPKRAKDLNTNEMNDSKIKKSIIDKLHNELDSDDEEDTAADFFGLTSRKNVPDSSVGSLDLTLPLNNPSSKSSIEETSVVKHMEDRTIHNSSPIALNVLTDSQSNKTLTSNVMNLPKEEILMKNKAEVGPKLPVPEQEYNVDTEGNIAFDEKAIEYLCGRRGIKRKDKEIDEANIIEINGEDIKPDEREWLVKALTEESVQRPISMQSCGINSQSKKKHQITYLAHQAKAMELELKNQWSQNKMARKQTKSKYGF